MKTIKYTYTEAELISLLSTVSWTVAQKTFSASKEENTDFNGTIAGFIKAEIEKRLKK